MHSLARKGFGIALQKPSLSTCFGESHPDSRCQQHLCLNTFALTVEFVTPFADISAQPLLYLKMVSRNELNRRNAYMNSGFSSSLRPRSAALGYAVSVTMGFFTARGAFGSH